MTRTGEAYNAACRPGDFNPPTLARLPPEGVQPPQPTWAARPRHPPPLRPALLASGLRASGGYGVITYSGVSFE